MNALLRWAARIERWWARRAGDPGAGKIGAIRNFAVMQHGTALGTVVHTTPLIRGLREAMPGCRLVVVASGFSREIYRWDPDVELIVETPSPLKDLWGAVRAVWGLRLFDGEPFCILLPLGNERGRVLLQALALRGCMRAGFSLRPEMVGLPLRFDRTRSQIANNLRIVSALGHEARHFEPRVCFAAADREYARGLLADAGWAPGQVVAVFVTQTSTGQRKGWRAARFVAAARFVRDRYGAMVVFVGAAVERAAVEGIASQLDFATANLAGQTSVLQLAALLSLCDVGLTLDTGAMHMGRAVGLPMVIVAPAWSPAIEWLPIGDARFRVLKNAETTEMPNDYWIDEVGVNEVVCALAELIAQRPEHGG